MIEEKRALTISIPASYYNLIEKTRLEEKRTKVQQILFLLDKGITAYYGKPISSLLKEDN